MNMTNVFMSRKMMIVLVIFVILLGGVVILKMQKVPTQKGNAAPTLTPSPITAGKIAEVTPAGFPATAQMVFNNVPKSIGTGESFEVTVDLVVKSQKLDGADAIVRFDPAYLSVSEITEGSYFSQYPRKIIDDGKGIVKVTAFRPKDENAVTNAPFFGLKILTKKAGSTRLTFDFQKGKTNFSTIVEKGTSRNILGSVGNATVVIEQLSN